MIRLALMFSRFSSRERAAVIEAGLSLLAVWLSFIFLSFPRALRLLRAVQNDARVGRVSATEAGDVSRAVARAARHVPFRAVCLQQAFAASLMLRRRGLAASVHLGLARGKISANGLKAHAWCYCGEVPVTGDNIAPAFQQIASFTV